MSKPLWLMMGSAFLFEPPPPAATAAPDEGVLTKSHQRCLFLTAKHTLAPWDHSKDASVMKIPEAFRKQRYVLPRLYRTTANHQKPIPEEYVDSSIVALHPHLDVAVLSVSLSSSFAAGKPDGPKVEENCKCTLTPCRDIFTSKLLLSAQEATPEVEGCTFFGFRGEGLLGKMDTFDASILQKLPPREREALLLELKEVEGKQAAAECPVTIVSARGAAQQTEPSSECYHGMSGGPLMRGNTCYGVLYGKHPDCPRHLGYTPTSDFYAWLQKVVNHLSS